MTHNPKSPDWCEVVLPFADAARLERYAAFDLGAIPVRTWRDLRVRWLDAAGQAAYRASPPQYVAARAVDALLWLAIFDSRAVVLIIETVWQSCGRDAAAQLAAVMVDAIAAELDDMAKANAMRKLIWNIE
jgi:hypothetical protein